MILCAGEALIDMLERPLAGGGGIGFAPVPGGAVFNTAIALGRLGAPAGYFGGLSRDRFGDQLHQALTDSGVDATLAPRVARPSTLAFVALVDGQARYEFFDEASAGRMLSRADLPDLGSDIDALFLGGISLMAEPCGSAFEVLALERAGDRLVMLDPNIRPAFIVDEAAYRARLARLMARADIVKLSDEDLAWLSGPGDGAGQARALLAQGPALVVLTKGAKGARAFTRHHEVRARAPKVAVADTVGAGDTFNAGLLAGLFRLGILRAPDARARLRDLTAPDLSTCLDLAARAAAHTVTRPGADPPWAHELSDLPDLPEAP